MPARRKATAAAAAAAAASSFMDLPLSCQEQIIERLPPNCIPLAIRQLSKELRQRYLNHTAVRVKGDGYLPAWAVLAALPQQKWYEQKQLVAALARQGDLEGMQQLAQHLAQQPVPGRNLFDNDFALCAAAAIGRLDIVCWLVVEKGCMETGCMDTGCISDRSRSTASAAGGGHVHVLEWLRRPGRAFLWATGTIAAAARGGHVATLQWLRNNGCCRQVDDPLNVFDVCAAAAEGGQLETLLWLRANGYWRDSPANGNGWQAHSVMRAAVRHGQVNVVRYMREGGFHWDEDDLWACEYAAGNGDIAMMCYLMEQGWPMQEDLCETAARSGRTDMLLWLRQHGHPWTERTFAAAAGRRDVQLLQWLRGEAPPCPWDSSVVLALACHWQGSLQCLEYVLSNGCPWDAAAFREVQKHPELKGVLFPGVRRSRRLRKA